MGAHYSDYQKEGDLTVYKSGKYLVQYNILNVYCRYNHFGHHDRLLRFFLLFLLISKIKLGAWRKRLCLHYYGDMGDEERKPNGVFEVLAALCSKTAGLGYGLAGTMETRLARSPSPGYFHGICS